MTGQEFLEKEQAKEREYRTGTLKSLGCGSPAKDQGSVVENVEIIMEKPLQQTVFDCGCGIK